MSYLNKKKFVSDIFISKNCDYVREIRILVNTIVRALTNLEDEKLIRVRIEEVDESSFE